VLNKLLIVLGFAISTILIAGTVGHYSTSVSTSSFSIEFEPVHLSKLATLLSDGEGSDREGSDGEDSHSATEASDKLFALTQLRSSASQFINILQIEPVYFLLIEFLAEDLSAKLFKNLTNPPNHRPWYIIRDYPQNKSKVSAWKDGNLLYKATLEYQS
jgi:hypothetical protein